tara:strand:- start:2942 stop:3940 length:999 start_codon:yes stop_codon:yes gene_type:complete
MKPSDMKKAVKELYKIKRTTLIEGKPGGGKTTLCRDVAKELNTGYVEVHMPTMLVEDFGIPMPQPDGTVKYTIPHWVPVVGSDHPDEGIIVLDDFSQAPADIQKVVRNMCQGRNLHEHTLKNWQFIMTGNRQSDRAGANRRLSHVSNAITVIELDTDLPDCIRWMLDNGVHPTVIAFINFKPNLLHDFDPQREGNSSPRAWVEGVSDVLNSCTLPMEMELEIFKGAVGEGCAGEFVAFREVEREMPNIDSILKSPTTAKIPEKPSVMYAVAGALAFKMTKDNIENCIKYLDRFPANEYNMLSVSLACRRDESVASTKAFTEWSVKHGDTLFN